MNNAFALSQTLEEEVPTDISPVLLRRAQDLADAIEAVHNIANSSYWKVLKQYVFDVDLEKARKSLAKEKDPTEMFRFQGEIRALERVSLERLLEKYQNELEITKKQINATKPDRGGSNGSAT